ncbi:MAG: hypothetical protein R2741_10950 [Methanolobus sp.]
MVSGQTPWDFKRNTDSSDLSCSFCIFIPLSTMTFEQLERPSMSIETLDVLGEAINSRL